MSFFTFLFLVFSIITFGIFIYRLFDDNTNDKPSFGKRKIFNSSYLLLSSCCFVLFLSLSFVNGYLVEPSLLKHDYTKIGAYGDFVGGILNPVVAFIGIVAASLAFYVQYKANTQFQKQFQVQQFESQFYEMLRLHKENINEMKITGYDISTQDSIEYAMVGENYIEKNKSTTNLQIVKYTEGRKVFVTMSTELIAIYEFLEYYNILYKTSITKDELLSFAYKLFFFGVKSDIPASEIILDEDIGKFKRHLNNIRSRHKESIGVNNLFQRQDMKSVELYVKYSPFSGHESRLGHYYRHLYSTVKFVVGKENELFTYKEVRGYLKILRSQMSNDEQLMLYYNCVIGFGKDWELNGYLTKYRMLHNLPINKVKYAPNPREYFSEYISSLNKDEGSLFEWDEL
ncbi:putative phage abortive infection protein [uncultured Polaribacter sp.]|uniref:putative phage abortive infection protein n=1 Tax=uncultured Polaribacter sp. TaxID=174711 RepID=UPI0030D7D024|tara:strand:- start:2016 stop:3215 length:1200 start_codon:yes stop_codon:yes gene_type:complete